MRLSVIIPSKTEDDPGLRALLGDLDAQTLPKADYEVLVETRGNSEQAKAYAINRASGEVLGFFCTDNRLRDRRFLDRMLWWVPYPSIAGAYTAHYDYVPTDTPLNRYFALLGGNDPVCWWLGKNDRAPWGVPVPTTVRTLTREDRSMPSIGDNGFFIRREVLGRVDPDRHFCIDAVDDVRTGSTSGVTFSVVDATSVWHKSGDSLGAYLRRRWRYTKELYWRDYGKRRWRMVATPWDWARIGLFGLASLVVLPHLVVALAGYRRVRDVAWCYHPLVCLGLTGLYGGLLLTCGIPSLLSNAKKTILSKV